jgi:hypothetical protein
MPTKREREYYAAGFRDGSKEGQRIAFRYAEKYPEDIGYNREAPIRHPRRDLVGYEVPKPKRKLSAWNKYVKANSKKPRFRYRNGKLNLKKMAVAFRRQKKR